MSLELNVGHFVPKMAHNLDKLHAKCGKQLILAKNKMFATGKNVKENYFAMYINRQNLMCKKQVCCNIRLTIEVGNLHLRIASILFARKTAALKVDDDGRFPKISDQRRVCRPPVDASAARCIVNKEFFVLSSERYETCDRKNTQASRCGGKMVNDLEQNDFKQ